MNSASRVFRLGILLSGRGSNLMAIQKAIVEGALPSAKVALVFSNRPKAPALAWAAAEGLPYCSFQQQDFQDRAAFEAEIVRRLQQAQVDWVILAGYDRIIGASLLSAFPGRIVNIHPSLLPAYGGKGMVGLKVHEAVLANGEAESGCTVHGVTASVDAGPILGQRRVPVLPGDTPEVLAARVLEQEHQLYSQVICRLIEQELSQKERIRAYDEAGNDDALV